MESFKSYRQFRKFKYNGPLIAEEIVRIQFFGTSDDNRVINKVVYGPNESNGYVVWRRSVEIRLRKGTHCANTYWILKYPGGETEIFDYETELIAAWGTTITTYTYADEGYYLDDAQTEIYKVETSTVSGFGEVYTPHVYNAYQVVTMPFTMNLISNGVFCTADNTQISIMHEGHSSADYIQENGVIRRNETPFSGLSSIDCKTQSKWYYEDSTGELQFSTKISGNYEFINKYSSSSAGLTVTATPETYIEIDDKPVERVKLTNFKILDWEAEEATSGTSSDGTPYTEFFFRANFSASVGAYLYDSTLSGGAALGYDGPDSLMKTLTIKIQEMSYRKYS